MDYLHHPETNYIIANALREDIGEGDHSSLSTIPASAVGRARCLVKEAGILAGVEAAYRVFALVDPRIRVTPLLPDGTAVVPGQEAFYVDGPVRSLLTAERTALNVLQRMSGVATLTHRMAALIAHTPCRLLDTRKTTPGFRHFEKWAVQLGGGVNHRIGLYDMVMIKDNHHDAAGGITAAIRAVEAYQQQRGKRLKVEVETRSLAEVEECLAVGGNSIHRIMLDNMNLAAMRTAVARIAGRYETEASGGINEDTIGAIAETGVDFVSLGALTHSYKSLDISLKIVKG